MFLLNVRVRDVTSAGMVGRGKVAPKIDFEISQSWKSGRIDTIT